MVSDPVFAVDKYGRKSACNKNSIDREGLTEIKNMYLGRSINRMLNY